MPAVQNDLFTIEDLPPSPTDSTSVTESQEFEKQVTAGVLKKKLANLISKFFGCFAVFGAFSLPTLPSRALLFLGPCQKFPAHLCETEDTSGSQGLCASTSVPRPPLSVFAREYDIGSKGAATFPGAKRASQGGGLGEVAAFEGQLREICFGQKGKLPPCFIGAEPPSLPRTLAGCCIWVYALLFKWGGSSLFPLSEMQASISSGRRTGGGGQVSPPFAGKPKGGVGEFGGWTGVAKFYLSKRVPPSAFCFEEKKCPPQRMHLPLLAV